MSCGALLLLLLLLLLFLHMAATLPATSREPQLAAATEQRPCTSARSERGPCPCPSRYATNCINHARRLFTMAKTNEGCYVNSVPDAANFYKSTHWMDHMAYAAAWMYAATGEQTYLTEAQTYYARHVNEENGGKVRVPRSPLARPRARGPLRA